MVHSSLFRYSLTAKTEPKNLNDLGQNDFNSANMINENEDTALLAVLPDDSFEEDNGPDTLDELAKIAQLAMQSSNQISDENTSSNQLLKLLGETMPSLENTSDYMVDGIDGETDTLLGAEIDTALDAGVDTGAGPEAEVGPGTDDGLGQFTDAVVTHTFELTPDLLESIISGSKINKKTVCIGLCTKIGK